MPRREVVIMIFTDIQHALRHMRIHLNSNWKNIKQVQISTYGIWTGIGPDGNFRNSGAESQEFIKAVNSSDLKADLIVGNTNRQIKKKIQTTQRIYKNINVYTSQDNHAKYIIFSDQYAMLGSANLTDSEWTEMIWCGYLSDKEYEQTQASHMAVVLNHKKSKRVKV